MSSTSREPAGAERDGTSQAGRALAALDPGYVSVDERTSGELLAFARLRQGAHSTTMPAASRDHPHAPRRDLPRSQRHRPDLPEVADAMREAALRYHGNPASQHDAGRRAGGPRAGPPSHRRRSSAARTTGMDADQLIFTSGGTESNNLALAWPPSAPGPAGGRPAPPARRRPTAD